MYLDVNLTTNWVEDNVLFGDIARQLQCTLYEVAFALRPVLPMCWGRDPSTGRIHAGKVFTVIRARHVAAVLKRLEPLVRDTLRCLATEAGKR